MQTLTRKEEQIMQAVWQIGHPCLISEILKKDVTLKRNTVAPGIITLTKKGYLKVEDIRYSQNVLARAYRPGVSFIEFLKDEYGEVAVENLFKKAINSLENIHEIEYLLDLISKKENALIKNG